METWVIVLIAVVASVIVLALVAWMIVALVRSNKEKKMKNHKVVNGVRYDAKDAENAQYKVGDFLLERGKEYAVGKAGALPAGKYTVVCADENMQTVALRVGGIVREYKHMSSIVISEGDKVSAVSANAILR